MVQYPLKSKHVWSKTISLQSIVLNALCVSREAIHLLLFNLTHKETHRLYKQKLEEVSKLQESCTTAITRQRKKLKDLTVSLEEWVLSRYIYDLTSMLKSIIQLHSWGGGGGGVSGLGLKECL